MLAEAAGVARQWRDAGGVERRVEDEALAAVLAALGYGPGDASPRRIAAERARIPPLLTADAGAPTPLPAALTAAARAELTLERGTTHALALHDSMLPGIVETGYHRLIVAGHELTLAVAPSCCFGHGPRRRWGASAQIYALRGARARGHGGFAELAEAATALGRAGADALAISPTHALWPGRGDRFSPYSPSSRLWRDTAFADPALAGLPPLVTVPAPPLIDWTRARPAHLSALRAAYASLRDDHRAEAARWAAARGAPLHRQALFDALAIWFDAPSWRDWPSAYHDPDGAAARAFAVEQPGEIAFHMFTQWLAERGLSAAGAAARDAGMGIGLIADLAVGVDPGGSDGWAMRDPMLAGLTIGAPPDPLGPEGQNWNLTGFSPRGLIESGFAPFIAMLRAGFAHAGGLRIDHAFGLARLWVIPEGRPSGDGAYLTMPFADLARLTALESHRARAIVIAEDLGTAPWGFTDALRARAMAGMRVLWFEREGNGAFRAADRYDPDAVAMTGTHDTPTVAGWWRGVDLDWAGRLGRIATADARAAEEWRRGEDRTRLWTAIGGGAPEPARADPAPAVAAALAHIGRTPCSLAIVPMEDLIAAEQQPNIPGTIDQHPNWRRRLPAPTAGLIAEPATAARIAGLNAARRG